MRDSLEEYLQRKLVEARFDDVSPDGWVWCSDSNAAIHVPTMAREIRELLAKEPPPCKP